MALTQFLSHQYKDKSVTSPKLDDNISINEDLTVGGLIYGDLATPPRLTNYSNTVIIESSTNVVTIGIPTFNRDKDTLMVYENSTFIDNPTDYTISLDSTTITKVTGTWETGTIFNLISFGLGLTSDKMLSVLKVISLKTTFTATVDSTTHCMINNGNYNYITDYLQVYYQNGMLYETEDYTINSDHVSIDLQGRTINTDEKIIFLVWKNVDTSVSGSIDGSLVINSSITNVKLSSDISIGSLAALNTTTKVSVTAAINEINTAVGGLSSSLSSQGDSIDLMLVQLDTNTTNISTITTQMGNLIDSVATAIDVAQSVDTRVDGIDLSIVSINDSLDLLSDNISALDIRVTSLENAPPPTGGGELSDDEIIARIYGLRW